MLHRWDLTTADAIELQRELASQIDVRTPLTSFNLVAGADVSYNKLDPTLYASVVVYRVSDGVVVAASDEICSAAFPYVPGLLSFREGPACLAAFEKLDVRPDVVMCDGHGLAHPRRFGLACHLGLWLNLPCFGCAKSRFIGKHKEPSARPGSLAPLMEKAEQLGYVVRTKDRVRPVFVSAGHLIDIASAVRVTLATVGRYRIPEPTRLAHLRVNALRRGNLHGSNNRHNGI